MAKVAFSTTGDKVIKSKWYCCFSFLANASEQCKTMCHKLTTHCHNHKAALLLYKTAKFTMSRASYNRYNLAHSAKFPNGLYILLALIFLFFFFKIFFSDFSDTNYLKIRWTDFRNLFTEWKRIGCRWSIWTSFFDSSRGIAMATN